MYIKFWQHICFDFFIDKFILGQFNWHFDLQYFSYIFFVFDVNVQFKTGKIYLFKNQFSIYPIKKNNPKILMSKSDKMFVWEKNLFLFFQKFTMETSCLVATFIIILFHILGLRSDTLRQCPRLRSDNGSDNSLFL
jgi:hypothetical protein